MNWTKILRITGIIMILASVLGVALVMTGCSSAPVKSREQVWIETHPTSMGDAGECIEFDGEPCDNDPYDLDDLNETGHKTPSVSKKPSPKPTSAVKPSPKKTKAK